eukprot:TRINITY_DN59819_c0_g1_i1.p1 TRINITY_DN59819_c0_g1~~TRINITY_DN59819_c0_g1_i1.p1  ORF type:complete len:255 (-),score=-13.25 TRINITY_DN59819_c0_g1_i1:158-901(-)
MLDGDSAADETMSRQYDEDEGEELHDISTRRPRQWPVRRAEAPGPVLKTHGLPHELCHDVAMALGGKYDEIHQRMHDLNPKRVDYWAVNGILYHFASPDLAQFILLDSMVPYRRMPRPRSLFARAIHATLRSRTGERFPQVFQRLQERDNKVQQQVPQATNVHRRRQRPQTFQQPVENTRAQQPGPTLAAPSVRHSRSRTPSRSRSRSRSCSRSGCSTRSRSPSTSRCKRVKICHFHINTVQSFHSG